ncbi:MAG: C10 family peptidase [Bacteroidales bacterium]
MKKIITFLIISLLINNIYAEIISIETAQKIAINFYSQKIKEVKPNIRPNEIYIKESFTINDQNKAIYYIFNISDFGYIVISAESNTIPVLAYSFESKYNAKLITPPFQMWMDEYKSNILNTRKYNILADSQIKKTWSDLIHNNIIKNTVKSVVPFVSSKWNQDNNYNIKCPADAAGPGGHCVTGCVATCLGQLMYYYRFPDHGTGSYSYNHAVYGNLSADYQNSNYNWDAMCNAPTKPSTAIGDLIFQAGVGVDMQYSANSSGMYNHSAAYVLKTYFKYSPAVRYVFRDSTNLRWDSLMVAQLDKKMPLYYAGWSVPNVNGHAFVCDGYQDTTYFHFNFGWGGNSDGYFYVNSLSPGGSNFNLAQELIINIYPDTTLYNYPSYCTGPKTLTAIEGSIEDGSGPVANYQQNSNCSWLIIPNADSVSSLIFNFSQLKTKSSHGVVKIYNGMNSSAPLLGSYSGDSIPTSLSINNKIAFVNFTSDVDSTKSGFFINYKATTPDYCTAYKYLNANSANFNDGSNSKKYNSNTYCKWVISPNTAAGSITLHFNNFSTETNKDKITVKTTFPDTVLATFSGNTIPADFTIYAEEVNVIWTTDFENEFQGWEISYTSSGVGINTIKSIQTMHIYPNPAEDILNISFKNDEEQNIKCEIFSLDGKNIYKEDWINSRGENTKTIHLNNIHSGIYLLMFSNDKNEIMRQKLVIR